MKPTTADRWLPLALFGLVLGRHHVVDLLARLFDNPQFARKAMFYAAAGIVGSALCGLVWRLTPWHPAETRIAVALVCCWGIMEEAQTTVCRIGLGLGQPAPAMDPWQNICDHLTGIPIGAMTMAIPVVIAYWLVHNKWGRYDV